MRLNGSGEIPFGIVVRNKVGVAACYFIPGVSIPWH